jgi:ribosome-interacting GTPase 1
MPMPHRTFKQVIKRRLVGKEGSDRTRELSAILTELQNYKNGPYKDLRRPVAALTRMRGVLLQLVEIPGLIDGASAHHTVGRSR